MSVFFFWGGGNKKVKNGKLPHVRLLAKKCKIQVYDSWHTLPPNLLPMSKMCTHSYISKSHVYYPLSYIGTITTEIMQNSPTCEVA